MVDEDANKLVRVDAFKYVTGAILTAGAGFAVAVGVQPPEAVQAGINVVLPTLSLAAAHGLNRVLRERGCALEAGYVRARGGDPEVARKAAEELKDNPDHHQRMLEAFRQMLLAIDPEVVDVIGYLTGQYDISKKSVDGHFRALGRLLCDLQAGELGELRTLLRGVLDCEEELNEVGEADVINNHYSFEGKPHPSTVEVDFGHSQYGDIGHLESAERLFLLLKREGFAGERALQESNTHSSPVREAAMRISFEEVRKILTTIDPQPTT